MNEKKKIIFIIPPDKIDTTRNPGYPAGNNRSRKSFTWHLASKKGKIFQNILKPAIIMIINKMHEWILGSWDPEGFIYDDPRLQYLDENLHKFIDDSFDHEQRKLDFMHKAVDIGLFLLKEDIYYRGRIFQMLNQLPVFELLPEDKINMDTFKAGVGSITLKELQKLEDDISNSNHEVNKQ